MPNVDYPLDELLVYKPELTAEPDFDQFWEEARKESQQVPLQAVVTPVDFPTKIADLYEVVYQGMDGTPVHGWYMVPKSSIADKPLPVMIRYHGYNGDRGKPHELLMWAAFGVASLSVDTRGQGGMTPDRGVYPMGGIAGWMTLGILDPKQYYYRQVYMDCVRAVDFACSREEIDSSRIGLYGGSQGGGLTLAVAAIDKRPKLAMPVFPYLCHFRRAVEMHGSGPYIELRNWFRRFDPERRKEDQVFRTLSYFDGMNMASRVQARVLMAITLQDIVCPPSTCFAAYNHLNTAKELKIYHDYGHESMPFHDEAMLHFAARYL